MLAWSACGRHKGACGARLVCIAASVPLPRLESLSGAEGGIAMASCASAVSAVDRLNDQHCASVLGSTAASGPEAPAEAGASTGTVRAETAGNAGSWGWPRIGQICPFWHAQRTRLQTYCLFPLPWR